MNEIIGVVIAVIGGIIHRRLQKNRLAVDIHMQWWIPLWTDILLPIVRWILYFLSLSERQFSATSRPAQRSMRLSLSKRAL